MYTRNTVDGGIQSSRLGVDVWEISTLQYSSKIKPTVYDFPIDPSISGVADLLVCNNLWRNNKKKRHFHLSMEVDTSSDFIQFNKIEL